MLNGTGPTAHLADYVYMLKDFRRIHACKDLHRRDPFLYSLLVFDKAEGELVIGGRSCLLRLQHIYVLPPDRHAMLQLPEDGGSGYCCIRFYALQPAGEGRFEPAVPACPAEWPAAQLSCLPERIREIEKTWSTGSPWDAMKASLLFQNLLYELFRQDTREFKSDLDRAIQQTLTFMEQHYAEPVTREMLAELAGLSPDYYSRVFKKRHEKSPMEYLHEIRIRQAKKLLVSSAGSLRSISQQTGFSDEYYFSRRFKAATGTSPIAYVKRIRHSGKVASLNHLVTGDLLALGIEPYAAVINDVFPLSGRLEHTIPVGRSGPDLEKLMAARPDLIMMRGSRGQGKSAKEMLFNQIAPTVTLRYVDDWRKHLQEIAGIVGKEREAAAWLARYDAKAEEVRHLLNFRAGEETFLIVGIGEGKLCVYGQRNLGTVMYGDLGLAAPRGVADIAHYREVALEELAAYGPDRILLTSYRHNGTERMDRAIRSEVAGLYGDSRWNGLKAVKESKVYSLYDSRHLYTSYNALSHDMFLDKVREWFLAEKSEMSKN
ncbi:helix-turn-helix domain-containing protein [Paenibacillus oralis]|nr:helix-turn-helix domain-containing protein [Paenibacillus oralis]